MKRGYIRHMEMNRTNTPHSRFDAQVGALLDRVHESTSIVDSLLAMPLPNDGEAPAPEWDLAVTRRLERRLVDAMRAILDNDEPARRSA